MADEKSEFDDLLGDPTKPQAPKIPFPTSAINHPTVFADGCVFATRLSSTVRITFFETMVEAADAEHPGPKHRHVGTLVMPLEGYADMLRYLNEVTPKYIFPEEAKDGE